MRNISLDDLRSMIRFYIDSDDETLIDNYTHKLLDLAKDFDAGLKHVRPTIEFKGKTYYGKKLEVKNGRLFIDGYEIQQQSLEYSGDVVIENNITGEKVSIIKIIGDLKAEVINNSGSLSCDKLTADKISVGQGLHCDDIRCTNIQTTDLFCRDITAKTIQVSGNLNCNEIKKS